MPIVWSNPETEYYVFISIIPWCIGELVRYPFYMEENPFKELFGHLRYNVFIPLYPIGVSGELFCFYWHMKYSQTLP
jgi:hypothetical protein